MKGLGLQGVGYRIEDSGFKGPGFRVNDSELGVYVSFDCHVSFEGACGAAEGAYLGGEALGAYQV